MRLNMNYNELKRKEEISFLSHLFKHLLSAQRVQIQKMTQRKDIIRKNVLVSCSAQSNVLFCSLSTYTK